MRILIQLLRGVLALVIGATLLASAWLALGRTLWGEDLPSLFGYGVMKVPDSAMAPTLAAGDGAVLRVGAESAPGDMVVFRDQAGELVLRRIVGTSEGRYITQGDGADQPDPQLLSPEYVEAVCVTYLPGAGAAFAFLTSPWGVLFWAALWLLVVLLPLGLARRQPAGKRYAP